MKIYPINDKQGRLHAFEIDNWKVSRRRAARIAMSVPGAIIRRQPAKLFSWFREEVFCEFELNDIIFQIDEPYGDNSRYWIGKKEEGGWCEELQTIKRVFQAAW